LYHESSQHGTHDTHARTAHTGQIELFTHYPVMRVFASELQRMGYQVCAVYTVRSLRFFPKLL
jgi:hypothetical protein